MLELRHKETASLPVQRPVEEKVYVMTVTLMVNVMAPTTHLYGLVVQTCSQHGDHLGSTRFAFQRAHTASPGSGPATA